jgi:hypothetical protein
MLMNIRQNNPPGQSETARERPRCPKIRVVYRVMVFGAALVHPCVLKDHVDHPVTGGVRIDLLKPAHILLCGEKLEERVSLALSLIVFSPRATCPFSGDPPSGAAATTALWPVSMEDGGPGLSLAGASDVEREDWVRWA